MRKVPRILIISVSITLLVLLASCSSEPAIVNGGTLRISNSTHPRESFFIADITINPSGELYDMSDDIQNALNQCSANGGGSVYLSAGKYRITKNIDIPTYVSLCGDNTETHKTIIIADVPENDSITEGLFNIGGSSGVMGLTVYYPNQSLSDVKKYPFTFYTDGEGSHYMMQTVKNCTVVNGYRGIGACGKKETNRVHEMLMVENFKGTFLLEGFEVYNQADVGIIQNVIITPDIWADYVQMNSNERTMLEQYTKLHTTGLVLSAMDWPQCNNITITSCKTGISIPKGPRVDYSGAFSNINITNCSTGMTIDALDFRWGICIFDSNIGKISNQSSGVVQLSNTQCSVSGEKFVFGGSPNIIKYEGEINNTESRPITDYIDADLDSTGATDCTAALQEILNQAEPGSVVYLKAGSYRFDGCITIPHNIELRGASPIAQRDNLDNGIPGGTFMLCYYGDGPLFRDSDTAFITMEESSGLCGIKILYPKNQPYDSDLHTTYAIRGNGSNIYLLNCLISSSYYGVDFRECDNHFIKQVCCCCYKNTFLLGGKNGIITDCLQNGTVITRNLHPLLERRMDEQYIFDDLFNSILRIQAEYIILDNAENETIKNTFCYGCYNFLTCRNNSIANALNIGADNLGGTMITLESSDFCAENVMRYAGTSYKVTNGSIRLWNRLLLGKGSEGDV